MRGGGQSCVKLSVTAAASQSKSRVAFSGQKFAWLRGFCRCIAVLFRGPLFLLSCFLCSAPALLATPTATLVSRLLLIPGHDLRSALSLVPVVGGAVVVVQLLLAGAITPVPVPIPCECGSATHLTFSNVGPIAAKAGVVGQLVPGD